MLRIFLLTLVLLFAAITGLLGRRIYMDRAGQTGFASFYVGGQTVTVNRAMIRNPELRDGGAVTRLDVAFTWPDFQPAGGDIGVSGRELVFVALEDPTSRKKSPDDIDPSERASALYARFLEADALTTAEGLVVRKFKQGSPYQGEELFVATPDERAFTARCPLAPAAGSIEELCLWQARINGLEVHTRFHRRVLPDWVRLAESVNALIPRLATRPTR